MHDVENHKIFEIQISYGSPIMIAVASGIDNKFSH